MAKFFNKEYKHAYKRGNVVWIRGKVAGYPYYKVSTNKAFTKANMNYAEKNWETYLKDYFEMKKSLYERDNVPLLDEYAQMSFEMNKSSRRFYTTTKYQGIYERFISPALGKKKIDEIKASDIKLWYNYLTKKINSHEYASKVRSILSTIMADAMEDEYVDRNIVKNIRFPKKENFRNVGEIEIDPFSLDEVMTLIGNAQGFFANILTFQFFTGTRPGEMIALKWDDINFKSKTIHIRRNRQEEVNPETGRYELGPTKTGNTRIIDMLEIVEQALKEQYKLTGLKGEFVFLSTEGKPYMDHEGLAKRQWKALLKRSLIDYRNFYQTRHTFASIFLSEGEDLAWVSKVMLGHANIQTTLRYYARFIKQKKVERGAFLNKDGTNMGQSKNLYLESS